MYDIRCGTAPAAKSDVEMPGATDYNRDHSEPRTIRSRRPGRSPAAVAGPTLAAMALAVGAASAGGGVLVALVA